jgi:hypothetical protein
MSGLRYNNVAVRNLCRHVVRRAAKASTSATTPDKHLAGIDGRPSWISSWRRILQVVARPSANWHWD